MIEPPLVGDVAGTSLNVEPGPAFAAGTAPSPGLPCVFGVDALEGADEVLLAIHGEVDIATAPLFQTALAQAAESGRGPVVLDLTDLKFIDASGIRVIVTARRLLRERRGDLSIRSAAPLVRRMFSIVELDDLLEQDSTSIAAPAT